MKFELILSDVIGILGGLTIYIGLFVYFYLKHKKNEDLKRRNYVKKRETYFKNITRSG